MVTDRVEPGHFDSAPQKTIWPKTGNQSKASLLNVPISFKDKIEKAFVEERKAWEDVAPNLGLPVKLEYRQHLQHSAAYA